MKNLPTFAEFLLEQKDNIDEVIKKIQYIAPVGDIAPEDEENLIELTQRVLDDLYIIISKKWLGEDKFFNYKLKKNIPTVYHCKNRKEFLPILKNNENVKNIYNPPSKETDKVTSKTKLYEILNDRDYVAKTAFNIDEAKGLKFPIVAKPAKGAGGIGIQKFNSVEDLEKSKDSFDVFCEFIKFEREFRSIFFRDKLITLVERIPLVDSKVDINTKSKDDKIHFAFIEQDISKLPFIDKLYENQKDTCKDIKLDFYSYDFVIDSNGKMWLIEINQGPGLCANSLCDLYEAIYEDFYKEKLPSKIKTKLENYTKEYNEIMKNVFSKEYKKSIAPV